MKQTTIYKIIDDQVKAKAQELSIWAPVRWEGGRLHYETKRLINEISDFDLEYQLYYLEKLEKEDFKILDNWPSSAPDITGQFRNWLTKIISQLKINKMQSIRKLQIKDENKIQRKKRLQIPYKIKTLLQREVDSKCPFCSNRDVDHFEIHHIDENPENNNFENLIMVCPTCHSKITKRDIERDEVINVKRTHMNRTN